ncbi:MAG TPA: PIN domain-containing protein [Spirochaetes bacterium]|nr:PIN domain-containing protein [Spirochaetota bacterium]
MKVLVDTSIWSIAFRRSIGKLSSNEKTVLDSLKRLIEELNIIIIGPIRQEILSGIDNQRQFSKLKEKLWAFDDLPIISRDYELAAEFYNLCRKNGIQGSHIDFLICAVALRNKLSIFTIDKDFEMYSKYTGINLFNTKETI